MLVIFPEGRITVTGSLMKVYDGVGNDCRQIRRDGGAGAHRRAGGDHLQPAQQLQVRRRLFPKITVTILEPVKLEVDPELKGRKRRQAAGAALYTIMSDLIFRTTPTDRTVIEALIDAAKIHGANWLAVEDPVSGRLTYKRLLMATAILGRKLMALAPEGQAARRHAADLQWRRGHAVRADVGGSGAGDDQFHRRRDEYSCRLPRRVISIPF